MSNYTKTTNFTAKDTLISGNPSKVVKGTEIDSEFTAIQTSVNSKSDTASPTFTGTATIPTAAITNFTLGGTSVTSTAAELNALDGITASVTELNYTDGVTSAIQTQLDAKAPLSSPVLVTPNLGTPSAATLTNATGLPIVAGTTGTLSTARGGTGVTTASNGQLLIGNGSGFTAATLTAGSGVTLTNGTGSIEVAFSGPGAGSVTSINVSGGTTGLTTSGGPVISSGSITLAGTLVVANGGTGATTLTAQNVILGNGTSAVQFVAPGSSGNVLTSNGSTWQSTAPAVTGATKGQAIAFSLIFGL